MSMTTCALLSLSKRNDPKDLTQRARNADNLIDVCKRARKREEAKAKRSRTFGHGKEKKKQKVYPRTKVVCVSLFFSIVRILFVPSSSLSLSL